MRRSSLARISVMVLTCALVLGATAHAQEAEKTQPKKKKPAVIPVQGQTQTQTAPAEGKGKEGDKAPKDPQEAGWKTVTGRIASVRLEQHAIVIRTSITNYEVFLTPQSQLTRDGKPADIKALQTNDRVDECHFNAKHVVQTLKVTAAEKNLTVQPNPHTQ